MRFRAAIATFVAALSIALTTAPALAGEPADSGEVLFRLTVRGTPPATDSFALAIEYIPRAGVDADQRIVNAGVRCGPGAEVDNPGHERCEAGDYDFVVDGAVGDQLSYVFTRSTDDPSTGGASGEVTLHAGTVTIAAHTQTVTLVFDYGLGLLPDTAAPNPGAGSLDWTATGLVALAAALVVARQRRPLRSASRATAKAG